MKKEYLELFGAKAASGSVITEREANGDKSVTIDSDEKQVLFSIYPPNSFTRGGGARPDRKGAKKLFFIYDILDANFKDPCEIAVKYPKKKGNELRLYFNRNSSFYPEAGDEWFIFTREGYQHPFIGFVKHDRLENLLSGEKGKIAFENTYALDEDDDEYLKAISSPKARQDQAEYTVTKYPRSPILALKAIQREGYKCQVNPEHETFISSSSNTPYMEVHHLIPICYSDEFEHSIDTDANLIVLCPNCHRMIHFSTNEDKLKLLTKFHEERSKKLKEDGIYVSLDKLLGYYKVTK